MTNNRALEFLYKAQGSFPILHDRWGWKSKQLVALAIYEVRELLEENENLRGLLGEQQRYKPAILVLKPALTVDLKGER